jgi:multidrug transporter EmrE-like cation transporter
MQGRSAPRADPMETVSIQAAPRAHRTFLGDAVSAVKLASIALILAGVIGLNLSGVTP